MSTAEDWVRNSISFAGKHLKSGKMELTPAGLTSDVAVVIHDKTITKLPIRILSAPKIDIFCPKLKTLEGLPETIHAAGVFSNALSIVTASLEDLTGAPKTIYGNVNLYATSVNTLRGIDKCIIALAGELVFHGLKLKSHLLGVMMVSGIKTIKHHGDISHDLQRAIMIVNNYLTKPGKTVMSTVLDCQEDLLNAGLDDYAEA